MHVDTLNPRSLVFMLSAIGLIMLPHTQHVSGILFSFFCVLLLWRFIAIRYNHYLPNRSILFLLTLFGMALLISQHTGLFGRDAGTALFVVALGLKLLEIRGKRDVYLVVYLAFVAVASQFLYEQSVLMAVYILLVCTVLLAALIIQNAKDVQITAALKTSATIILQALPLAIVVFVLFPRLEAPRWMWLNDEHKGMSGLSDTLEPGSISDLSRSDELVFRARFDKEIPPPAMRYWRGPVYSHTDGLRWSISSHRNQRPREPSFSGVSYSYTLMMEPQKENWVFALDMPESFDSSLHRTVSYQLQTGKRPGERNEYHINSRTSYNTGHLSQAEYRENLQLPAAPSTRQRELIRSLQGFEVSPELFIHNLLQYFRQEEFFYTLTPPLMLDDPIDTFLFEARSGFCSHYATAFVYLLRGANIPARVVGGYQGGTLNQVGGFFEVRQADAHAWAEAWLEGKGWVRFDPTAAIAPERIERGVNIDMQIASGAVSFSYPIHETELLRWLKRSRQLWQSIDYNWQRWVINYHSASQMQFLELLGIKDLAALVKWMLTCLVLITLPLAWFLLRSRGSATDKSVRYYQAFCAKLASAGIEMHIGEGAKTFSERVEKRFPSRSTQVAQITALFVRLRYQANADVGDLHRLKKLVNEFRVS